MKNNGLTKMDKLAFLIQMLRQGIAQKSAQPMPPDMEQEMASQMAPTGPREPDAGLGPQPAMVSRARVLAQN